MIHAKRDPFGNPITIDIPDEPGPERDAAIRSLHEPATPPAIQPAVRDAVNSCPERGSEGGLVLTDDERSCCGGGAERTECRAGKGARPGRVTLRECLSCAAERLG